MRVQPHLKKCFEGIYTLDFNADKEIVGMASAEGEIVKLSQKIQPADAKVIGTLSFAIVVELALHCLVYVCHSFISTGKKLTNYNNFYLDTNSSKMLPSISYIFHVSWILLP